VQNTLLGLRFFLILALVCAGRAVVCRLEQSSRVLRGGGGRLTGVAGARHRRDRCHAPADAVDDAAPRSKSATANDESRLRAAALARRLAHALMRGELKAVDVRLVAPS